MRTLLLGLALAGAAGPGAADPLNQYRLHCMGCHRPDGAESPGKVPALRGSVDLFLLHPEGRAYLAQVPGVAQAPLSDTDLAALLNWTVKTFGAGARSPEPPFTAGEVARWRRAPLAQPQARRRALLAPQPGG